MTQRCSLSWALDSVPIYALGTLIWVKKGKANLAEIAQTLGIAVLFSATINPAVQHCPDTAQQNIYGYVQHLSETNTKFK